MSAKFPVVSIVGRTNVGKSTLFNAILGKRLAIVEDEPGVTRDKNHALVKRFEFPFTLVDTGGLSGEDENPFRSQVRAQAESAIAESDLVLVVLDGIFGLHPLDNEVVQIVRASQKPVMYLVNKCERDEAKVLSSEFYSLGIDELFFVAAAHKVGIKELVEQIIQRVGGKEVPPIPSDLEQGVIRLAILGKPNVGKSTLFNKLVGKEVMISSPVAGTTRDTINYEFSHKDRKFRVSDTAGLRRKARVEALTVERYSNLRALRALAECDIGLLLLDATEGLPAEQDLKVASLIHERGRGLIIVVNKWDAVEKDHRSVKEFERMIRAELRFGGYAPICFVSALSGKRCVHILDKAIEIYDSSEQRFQTSDLNKILSRAVERKPPPSYRAEPIKLFFATQTSVRPPEFVLFMNHPAKINGSYQRYLKNIIREHYPSLGFDIKLHLRKRTDKAERLRREAELS